tara:strand:+ start:15 stop:1418 length:1404 start_codon:yes stop_codon:yes gene_type:complete
MKKLGIIVPYRNRPEHLKIFIEHMSKYLKDLDYELIVVEQQDDNDFNRGKLLNIGFIKAENLGCDYVVFHDIDMLPVNVDYSHSDEVVHLVDEFETPKGFERDNFDEYFGGVTLFPSNIFKHINGYTNEYWGWGFEDDNLMLRCKDAKVKLGRKIVVQRSRDGVGLKFNGKNSYAVCPNVFNSVRDFTVVCNFSVDKIESKENEIADTHAIFSIPGFDTVLTYNSFRNFAFQFWKKDLSSMNIPSEHFPDGTYTSVVTIQNKSNPKKVTFHLNGVLVGELTYDKLYDLKKANYFFLGVGDPERESKENWLNGNINTFAVFNEVLSDTNIKRISNTVHNSLFSFCDNKMLVYYDGKFKKGNELIDLSGNGKNAITYNCTNSSTQFTKEVAVGIPLRRKGKLKALIHDENGYTEGYWKTWQSRINQLDYLNKHYNKNSNYKNEGLSTLEYHMNEDKESESFHHLKVTLT